MTARSNVAIERGGRLVRRLLALLIAITLAGPASTAIAVETATPAALDGYAHTEWLVDGEQLQELLAMREAVKVVALTAAEDFAAGHIPGAVQIDWPALEIVETGDQRVTSWRAEVEAILTELGISPDDTVVVYDGGTLYGARLWWILDQLGHTDKRILNGGLPAWITAGGNVESGAPTVAPAPEPYAGKPNDDVIATIDEVQAIVDGEAEAILVDARRPDEYEAGHVPGAVNVPFTLNASAEDPRTWKSVEELRAMYAEAGVTPDQWVVPYCTTGVRSAVTYFTLRLIGFERVSLFTGSFKEWSSDSSRPIETGA